jgi:hypothetical protein
MVGKGRWREQAVDGTGIGKESAMNKTWQTIRTGSG